MKHIIAFVMAFFLSALPSTSLAAPVTFSFSGEIVESALPDFPVGTEYSGNFIVDFDLVSPNFSEDGSLTGLPPTFVGGDLLVGSTSLAFSAGNTFYESNLYVGFRSLDGEGNPDNVHFALIPIPKAPYAFSFVDGHVPSYFSSGLWVQNTVLWFTQEGSPGMATGVSANLIPSVPEPASAGLLAGLLALAFFHAVRRRKDRS